jgi:serine/threonine-protein kinase
MTDDPVPAVQFTTGGDSLDPLPRRRGAAAEPAVRAGMVLAGRFRLVGLVGAGGMSTVWRARDEVLNRWVAVKVLASDDAAGRARGLEEARAAAGLSHPHITNVYDFGETLVGDDSAVAYVVMELLQGSSLARRMRENAPDPATALSLLAEVASAVAAAHASGVVHRDIKPSNIVLTEKGAKVIDFGIAAMSGDREVDAAGDVIGTPAYVAPERLSRDDVAPASDVYSLGVLIHFVLSGRMPWPVDPASRVPPAVPAVLDPLPGVPPQVHTVLARCLLSDPSQRPSAAEVEATLVAARTPDPVAAGPIGSAWRVRVAAVAGIVAAVAVGAVAVVVPGSSGPDATMVNAQPSITTSERPAALASGGTSTTPDPGDSQGPRPGTSANPAPRDMASPSAGPTDGSSTVDPTAGPTTGPPSVAMVTALGGVVRIECSGSTARITDVFPADGYQITRSVPGPADTVQVFLMSATNLSMVKAHCSPDGVVPQVTEHKR